MIYKERINIYSKIFDLWKNEINAEELTKIESDFLQQVEDYIKRLLDNREKTKNQLISLLIEKKLFNFSYMLEEIYRLRLKKSINFIMNGKSLQKDILCIEELNIFSTISKILNNYLENINLILKGETPQKLANEALNGDYFVVRFLKEVPQIIGIDLKQYGPFLIDDIAVLPKKNVETLLEHQAVILIKKK